MKKRAISPEEKQLRKQAILEIARQLFQNASFQEIKMEQIAKEAGLAKGTLFLYFKSKEQLFLEVMITEYIQWVDQLAEQLPKLNRHSAEAALESLLAYLDSSFPEHVLLFKLLAIFHPLLEPHVAVADLIQAKGRLFSQARQTGEALEHHLTFLKAGQGVFLLQSIHAMLVGFKSMYDPDETIQAAAGQAGLPLYEKGFQQAFLEALSCYLRGLMFSNAP